MATISVDVQSAKCDGHTSMLMYRSPRVSTIIGQAVENERAYAGRDGRTSLMGPNYLRRERGQKNLRFPSLADHEKDWQPYPVDPYIQNKNSTGMSESGSCRHTVLMRTVPVVLYAGTR